MKSHAVSYIVIHVHIGSISYYSVGSSTSILNKVPSLNDAFKVLRKKSADWHEIGRALDGVSGKENRNIRKGLNKDLSLDNSTRLEEILNIWLEQGGASSTWGQLMEALKEDYFDVVNNIEEFLGLPMSIDTAIPNGLETGTIIINVWYRWYERCIIS